MKLRVLVANGPPRWVDRSPPTRPVEGRRLRIARAPKGRCRDLLNPYLPFFQKVGATARVECKPGTPFSLAPVKVGTFSAPPLIIFAPHGFGGKPIPQPQAHFFSLHTLIPRGSFLKKKGSEREKDKGERDGNMRGHHSCHAYPL